VWGYFKRDSTEAEKQRYLDLLATLTPNSDQLGPYLKQLAVKYQVKYLLASRLMQAMQN
jgi:steroid 5-alpha reductase family enzyme